MPSSIYLKEPILPIVITALVYDEFPTCVSIIVSCHLRRALEIPKLQELPEACCTRLFSFYTSLANL